MDQLQQQVQDLAGLVAQQQVDLNAAHAAAAPANAAALAAGAAHVAPLPGAFSVAPALANNGVMDLTTSAGIKLYKSATAALKNDFDLSQDHLNGFMGEFSSRSEEANWAANWQIPTGPAPHVYVNMLVQHGRVTLEEVQNFARTFAGLQVRLHQNSNQIKVCLLASLTQTAQTKIRLEYNKYTINGVIDGACLLKVILQASHLDTRGTASIIRVKLSQLDQLAAEVGYDVDAFVTEVKRLHEMLLSRGEGTSDMLNNLFMGFRAFKDKTFLTYIANKEERYDEGEDLTAESLMDAAANRYKKLKELGLWEAPTEDQKKITALTAQLVGQEKQLQVFSAQMSKQGTSGKEKPATGAAAKTNADKPNEPYVKPKWMLLPPEKGGEETVRRDGYTFYWCRKHESWGKHLPSKCEGRGFRQAPKKPGDSPAAAPEVAAPPKLKLTAGMTAIQEDEDF
jgi:hypothetical protein